MKKSIRTSILTTLAMVVIIWNANAQTQIFDVVSIGAGYTNQSFYSMANGEVSNVTNTDWDLGFQISGFQATIMVNGKNNVHLFKANKDINEWSTITPNDTVGYLNSNYELLNQDTSWWSGAFNITNNAANMFDLGWGVYDLATHAVTGDSLYFIKLSTGDIKKIWIQQLANNVYNFAYANLDGTNEVNTSVSKTNFAGKNFGYYSITNGTTIDREPNKYTWDLTFSQYESTFPITYKVSGVLSNDSVQVAKAYPVDPLTVSYSGLNYSYYINTIGYEWKSYDFNNNIWTIDDSTAYFVFDRSNVLWKLVFTGFGGSTNGNFEFYKEQVSATGLTENGGKPALLSVYPNPAETNATVVMYINKYDATNSAGIYDIDGRKVEDLLIPATAGLSQINVPVSSLPSGMYFLKTMVDGQSEVQKLTITR